MPGVIGSAILIAAVLIWAYIEIWLLIHPPYFGLTTLEEFFIVLALAIYSLWSIERAVNEHGR